MKSRQPQKNQPTEGRPDGQTPRPRRFRIIKLEERIAPKKGGNGTKHACATVHGCATATCPSLCLCGGDTYLDCTVGCW